MARLYLALILLAVLIALLFSDTQFLFESRILNFLGRDISLTSQILLSGLIALILVCLFLLGLIEKIILISTRKPSVEKKKEMATKE